IRTVADLERGIDALDVQILVVDLQTRRVGVVRIEQGRAAQNEIVGRRNAREKGIARAPSRNRDAVVEKEAKLVRVFHGQSQLKRVADRARRDELAGLLARLDLKAGARNEFKLVF